MLPPKTRTLVVDDNQSDRIVVRALLEKLGLVDVHIAEDGAIAEAKLTTAEKMGQPFQLVIVDWNMPGLNGLGVLQFVRQSKISKFAKVMIMTSAADESVVQSALVGGTNDFLIKPVKLPILRDKLEKLFLK